uniref:Uncharacterized protein n=1 Tax=Anguilla anguilla TaxID=7936 RepID=A0A0E9PZH9_ANGAN
MSLFKTKRNISTLIYKRKLYKKHFTKHMQCKSK